MSKSFLLRTVLLYAQWKEKYIQKIWLLSRICSVRTVHDVLGRKDIPEIDLDIYPQHPTQSIIDGPHCIKSVKLTPYIFHEKNCWVCLDLEINSGPSCFNDSFLVALKRSENLININLYYSLFSVVFFCITQVSQIKTRQGDCSLILYRF